MRLVLVLLLLAVSLARAQGPLAAGTYGMPSGFGFSNSSAFTSISSSSISATQAVFEVNDASTTATTSMILEDNFGNSARLSIVSNIGYTSDGSLTLSTEQCITSENGLGIDLCAAARAANGCSRSYTWGQATTATPFPNRTLILIENFCGSNGVVAFTCGAIGGCNEVPENTLALPLGDYELYGLVGGFIYDSPLSDAITLSNASLSMLNNFEYVSVFSFLTSSGESILVKTYAAVVPNEDANLLFSIYNCSQSQSTDVDVCSMLENNGGCEVTVPDSQIDLDPPNNLTLIQLPLWCNIFGIVQLKCSTTCEGPINRGSSPAQVGFQAGNCLAFQGDILSVISNGCTLNSLTINELIVANQTVLEQTIVQQTVTNQTVVEQTIVQQTVVQQTIENQTVTQQTVLNQTVTNATVENLSVTNLYYGGVPLIASTSYTTTMQFYQPTNVAPPYYASCGSQVANSAPTTFTVTLQRVANTVFGQIVAPVTPFINPQWAVDPSNGCVFWGPTTLIPANFRPTQYMLDMMTAQGLLYDTNPTKNCFCTTEAHVTASGYILWTPYSDSTADACCVGGGSGGFDKDSGPYVTFFRATPPPANAPYQQTVSFSYLIA